MPSKHQENRTHNIRDIDPLKVLYTHLYAGERAGPSRFTSNLFTGAGPQRVGFTLPTCRNSFLYLPASIVSAHGVWSATQAHAGTLSTDPCIIPSISSTAGLLLSSDHLAHLARKAASAELGGSLLLVAPKTPSTEWHDKDFRGPPIFEGLRSSRLRSAFSRE